MQKFSLLLTSASIYLTLAASIIGQSWAEEVHTYGPIQPGDMLWNIAAKVSPPSVSRHQAILALQKANPHAFSLSCNINTLKIGKKLRIPSLSDMQTVSREQAIKELNRQHEEWKNRRRNPIVCPPVVEKTAIPEEQPSAELESTPQKAPEPVDKAKETQPPLETVEKNNETPTKVQTEPTVPSTTTAMATDSSKSSPPPVVTTTDLAPAPTSVSSTPVEIAKPTDNTQTVALVPEPVVQEPTIENTTNGGGEEETPSSSSTPKVPPSSSMTIVLLTVGGVLAAFLIGWLLHQHAKNKTHDNETSEDYTFSEPLEEMPLPANTQEKQPQNMAQDENLPKKIDNF